MDVDLRACADSAILVVVEDGEPRPPGVHPLVADLVQRLRRRPPDGVLDLVPSLTSLLVVLDPTVVDPAAIERGVRAALDEARGAPTHASPSHPQRRWSLPLCTESEHAPDLRAVAAICGVSADAVVAALLAADHRVALLGNQPGLPYLTGLDSAIAPARLPHPRAAVAPGAVGVAIGMTCIYPRGGPGGWHIVGRTPARLLDARLEPPVLLAPGDAVRFTPVDAPTFAVLDRAASAGEWSPVAE